MTLLDERPAVRPKPVFEGTKRRGEQFALYTFVIVPFLAFLAAVPVAWGWGLGWTDVVLFLASTSSSGLGHHRRLPPAVHARLVQGEPAAAHRAGDRRVDGDRGPGHPLGRRPPPPPRLQRPRGRSALAVALRRHRSAR